MRSLLLVTTAVALAVPVASAGAATDGRLEGGFSVNGRVTDAYNVRGEHRGDSVRRRWVFHSTCSSGPCRTVGLRRQRGSSGVDRLTLRRTRTGLYTGTGLFYQELVCNHHRYPHGGRVPFRITVRITGTRSVQSTHFATSIRATYVNTHRDNLTRCSGFLGHDAASYSGSREGRLPQPPHGSFTYSAAPAPPAYDFHDTSTRGARGAHLVGRRWNFGDPDSGRSNSSTAANPSHTFVGLGTHTVTLKVRDANGLTATVSQTVAG
jgi:hypothetical protein